jgi:hypothetical protein
MLLLLLLLAADCMLGPSNRGPWAIMTDLQICTAMRDAPACLLAWLYYYSCRVPTGCLP